MYNTIYLNSNTRVNKLQQFRDYKIAYLPNPTWKVLQVAPPTYQEFCDGLVYLPCLYHMTQDEMRLLASIVNIENVN